jgi:Alpha/beta hydrolase domain containing 18
MASWYARAVHRYERMRWAQEPNRLTPPFSWGLEHIGGEPDHSDPRDFLDRYVAGAVACSDDWFTAVPSEDCALEENVLTFTSGVVSPWRENNRVHAQLFQAGKNQRAGSIRANPPSRRNGPSPARESSKGPAVVVLTQWNSGWEEQQSVCRWLNKLGITAIKMSLPYHDRRAVPGHPRADHLVGPNIGLTLQANRQAVIDVRHTLRWLEREGYGPLGVLGTSIGSCIGCITLCHEPLVRAAAFLHVSTYFGDVVAQGLTTMNVWEPLDAAGVSQQDVRRYWLPISPLPYVSKLRGAGKKILMITARYDPTFLPEFTAALFENLRGESVKFESFTLPCGHYSLGVTPFKQAAGYRFGTFLQRQLCREPD